MAKPQQITLGDGTTIPIIYEDRSVLAIDKPPGWMLAPGTWDRTGRNLQLAIESSIGGGEFWARSRNLKFLRFVHRLDAETSGVTLLVKNPGAVRAYSELFEAHLIEKVYLAVVRGQPKQTEWTCDLSLAPASPEPGKMIAVSNSSQSRDAKPAETHFQLLKSTGKIALVAARPLTGRTHQIRVHLAAGGFPVLHDRIYGPDPLPDGLLALRAVALAYRDAFTGRPVRIEAPVTEFARRYGFALTRNEVFGPLARQSK